MTAADGWSGMYLRSWSDLAEVRARLAAGASVLARPLCQAAQWGTPEVVAELASHVADLDGEYDGRTALWIAVYANEVGNAQAVAEAGADPWRPMMAGWSPGRLSLASQTPTLFTAPAGTGLSTNESAAVAESHRLSGALGNFSSAGLSLSCVSGITAAQALRRLEATVPDQDFASARATEFFDNSLLDGALLTVGITEVPGGCIVSQPWAYGASATKVGQSLSAGTVCYSMYANPKSGNQGSVFRDGIAIAWDLNPGGIWPSADDPPDEILRNYLYQYKAVAYCCAYTGLNPVDSHAFTGSPGLWARLPAS